MTVPKSWKWESSINLESQHYLWKWKPPSMSLWAVTSLFTSERQLSAGSWVCPASLEHPLCQQSRRNRATPCSVHEMHDSWPCNSRLLWVFSLCCCFWLQIQYTETNSFFTVTVKRLTPQLLRTLIKGQHVLCRVFLHQQFILGHPPSLWTSFGTNEWGLCTWLIHLWWLLLLPPLDMQMTIYCNCWTSNSSIVYWKQNYLINFQWVWIRNLCCMFPWPSKQGHVKSMGLFKKNLFMLVINGTK